MDKNLFEAEFKLAEIIWMYEPIQSGELAKLCQELLGWKRTTTYTVLKKLCLREIVENDNAIVTSIVKKQEILHHQSTSIINKNFNNSLPNFITSFIGDKKITKQQADELFDLIEKFKED